MKIELSTGDMKTKFLKEEMKSIKEKIKAIKEQLLNRDQ